MFDVLPGTKMSLKKHAKLQIIRKWILVYFIGLPWPLNFIHWSKIEVKLLAKTSTAMLKVRNGSFYDANSKGRIYGKVPIKYFSDAFQDILARDGFFILWRFKKILLEKILSRFLSHYKVSS